MVWLALPEPLPPEKRTALAFGPMAGQMAGRRLASIGYRISLVRAEFNQLLVSLPPELAWAVLALPLITCGVALALNDHHFW